MIALAAICLAWTMPATAAEPEPDPYILALTREKLDVEILYSEDLSQPLSREALQSSEEIVGYVAYVLTLSNEGREADVVAFLNDSFVPALLADRDDFVCRRTRAFYPDLLRQADAYLAKTGRDSSFRKYAAMCDCLSPLAAWPEHKLYYFLMLTWDDLESRQLVIRKLRYEGLATQAGDEISRVFIEKWMSRIYDLSTPCGAPWAPAAEVH